MSKRVNDKFAAHLNIFSTSNSFLFLLPKENKNKEVLTPLYPIPRIKWCSYSWNEKIFFQLWSSIWIAREAGPPVTETYLSLDFCFSFPYWSLFLYDLSVFQCYGLSAAPAPGFPVFSLQSPALSLGRMLRPASLNLLQISLWFLGFNGIFQS